MNQPLFKIRNVVCSYDGITPVLKIEHLDIPSMKQTVFIGKSGAGKSTMLETLGLMNKTIIEGDLYFNPERDISIDISTLWKDEDRMSDIRNRYFSFIFQNTNLMNNFTAFENCCLPQMLQTTSYEVAKESVREAMDRVGLNDIKESDLVAHLSGGQRQRLAFVRAITPEFVVLFGDEPTGNLDELNSRELMRYIDSDVRKKKRSAVLVSHDIDLAMEFADQIVLLTKTNGSEYGYVDRSNIYVSSGDLDSKKWETLDGQSIKDLRSNLLAQLM